MWEGFIGNQIRRANSRLLVVNVLFLLGVIIAFSVNWNYMNNWFRGCAPTDPQQVARLTGPDQIARNFVQLDVPEVFESGYQWVEQDERGNVTSVKADFQVAWVGDRALIVKTKQASKDTRLSGQLVDVPPEVLSGLRQQLKPEQQGVLLPFMLDTVDYRDNGWLMLGISLPILAIVLWNLWKWMVRTRDFANHPIAKEFGGQQALIQWGAQIETEMSGGGEKFGAATLTANWLVAPYFMGTRIARLDDLAWVYKKITQHRVNFVPAGKTYEALLYRRNGTTVSVPGKLEQTDKLLQTIATRFPWIIAGWTAELDAAWKKDRNGFLAAVEQRRAKAKGAAATS